MPLDNKTISEAIKQAKTKSGKKKFNQTVDLILDIVEIDMKSPEGKIQEVVELPHVTGKPNKICVVASSGDFIVKAKNSQADKVVERADLRCVKRQKERTTQTRHRIRRFHLRSPIDASCRQNPGSSFRSKRKDAYSSSAQR